MTTGPSASERSFPSTNDSVRATRSFVREFAEEWTDLHQRVNDIELATSELATNAIVHGNGTTFSVRVDTSKQRFALRVTSSGSGKGMAIRVPTPTEPTGRGLQIASRLGDEFFILDADGEVVVTCIFERQLREARY